MKPSLIFFNTFIYLYLNLSVEAKLGGNGGAKLKVEHLYQTRMTRVTRENSKREYPKPRFILPPYTHNTTPKILRISQISSISYLTSIQSTKSDTVKRSWFCTLCRFAVS